jgi:hypothetical protein
MMPGIYARGIYEILAAGAIIFEACIAFDISAEKYVAAHLIQHKFPPKSIRDFY